VPGENSTVAVPAATPVTPVTATAPAVAPVVAKPAGDPPAPAAPATDGPVLGAEDPTKTAPVSAAPEKYDFKAPEGQQLDTAQLEAFTPLFKELGFSQDVAQKLVDKSFEIQKSTATAFDKEVQDSITKQNAEWVKASREDKEFGGADFEKNSKIADRAFSLFANPELKQLMKESGFDRHPEVVRLFWKIGQKLGESAAPMGNGMSPNVSKTTTQTLYPSMQGAQ
jgi:hypothetical protein